VYTVSDAFLLHTGLTSNGYCL